LTWNRGSYYLASHDDAAEEIRKVPELFGPLPSSDGMATIL
jgi:hypothetical protein